MNRQLYLDIDIVQTVPPSNINRDDNGTPKHATYGGVRRARVSSQAWKRATRTAFALTVDPSQLGTRTKRLTPLLTTSLTQRANLDEEAANRLATAIRDALNLKQGKNADQTEYLLFFGRQQLDAIADLLADRAQELAQMDKDALGKELKSLPMLDKLTAGHPLDVGLFGRMVANNGLLNVDAAVQVAHALSTHAVDIEFDYYTAVDDEQPESESGAGMIGTVEFNSATLYRYATVGIHLLQENLQAEDAVLQACEAFLDCFTRSMPTGHANTFAHRTLPHLVIATLREDQPVNLVSAFERPVTGGNSGLAEESMRRLAAEHAKITTTWGSEPRAVFATYHADAASDEALAGLPNPTPFPQLVEQVREAVATWLAEGERR
ncbi:type I-E CRISPR-associated protein Cas7/Cse4/CasC [Catenulispora pinisilvae]|uniref:type I-E CRISPR-associated protein Cas7/Cse4/CasC n=1 Tax=Catenulispora pinisilvae TaxID=2705253 RepID=UPI001891FC7D|nr:type I-E CRISPR-associated protein Cas7/Cse4/CasC [Catenulispora pinisilvae]